MIAQQSSAFAIVPQGHLKIAQPFMAGWASPYLSPVPEGRQNPFHLLPRLIQSIPSYPNLSQQFLEKNRLFNFGLRLCAWDAPLCVRPISEACGRLLSAIVGY